MATRNYVTRKEYNAWISECTALAIASGYPVQDDMINDNTGLVFGEDQYEAFVNGNGPASPTKPSRFSRLSTSRPSRGFPRAGWSGLSSEGSATSS